MTARSAFSMAHEVSPDNIIDLSPQADDIRAIVPVPQDKGTPSTTRCGHPSHTWTVMDSNRRLIGYLCLHVTGEKEQVLLWIFGENPAGRQDWRFKRAPLLERTINEVGLRQRPSAQIIIASQDQSTSSSIPWELNDDHVVVQATILFDPPAVEQIATSPRPAPSAKPACKKARRPDPIVLGAQRRDAAKRPDGDIEPVPVTISSAAKIQAAPSQSTLPAAETNPRIEEAAVAQSQADRHTAVTSIPSQETPSGAGSEISMIRASDLVPERLEYLWNGRIARGKLTIVAGDPGLGKSLLAAHLAAIVSQGSAWAPDEEQAVKGPVIIVTTEDGLQDTVRPRLEAAGADLEAVHLLPDLDLTQNQDALEQKIGHLSDARLMIIDPITSCLGRTNINSTVDVRAVITPLSRLAARTGVAIVAITHLNKNGSGRAVSRTVGSHAFVAVARSAYVLTKDPDDPGRRLLLPLKNNLGADNQSSAFRIEEVALGVGTAPRLVPDPEPVIITADEALTVPRGNSGSRSSLDQAKDFLREFLGAGPRAALAVQAAAATVGIRGISLQRAKKALGIQSSKSAMDGGWQWMLPADTKMINRSEDDQSDPMSTFEANDHLRSANPAETTPSCEGHS